MKALFISLAISAAATASACPTVEFRNVKEGAGSVMAVVYDSEQGYNKKSVAAIRVSAGSATVVHKLCGFEGKTIAISAFQDLNGDGKLNFNLMGIPTEPWAASGKPSAFAAPSWATTNVVVGDAAVVVEF